MVGEGVSRRMCVEYLRSIEYENLVQTLSRLFRFPFFCFYSLIAYTVGGR